MSEYVKVYTSLWVLDLSRRSSKVPDGTAETYLRTLDQRHPELRPHRGATWYRQLARYEVGKIGYAEILAAADTRAKQAEIYFYEAMRRLADGKSDDAHQLWQKVVDTKMFSFFEFDMASRYLRVGAPIVTARRAQQYGYRDDLRASSAPPVCGITLELFPGCRGQVVRQGSAKPSFPGSNPGGTSNSRQILGRFSAWKIARPCAFVRV